MEQGPVQAHGGGAEGRQSGDCPALFFWGAGKGPAHAWRGSTDAGALAGWRPGKTNGPALRGRLPSEVPTSDRAGTGGIQMFLSDIDVELFAAARVVFVTL
ncbi:hypothetical protein E4420_09455 [Stenotrophomonas maltophilia]|nr:hypothetical protein [Stenotrophomonas maltophilia]OMO39185.1 hypothetical protein BU225_20165 [Stenotrophomonas sp. MB339]MBA0347412.1 hypothetical protein [Stenotrophomonas maltophilia]MBA0418296.1 hypothetical protein [Stenotrophomonas maltophilia]PJL55570.1 hypothetical protein B9Y73_06100 [Stenotrophomonas maltophilia]